MPDPTPSDAPVAPPSAPARFNPKSKSASLRQAGRVINDSRYLHPWMRTYAEWLVLDNPIPPKKNVCLVRAREFSRLNVIARQLRTLESREDFRAYCEELRKGPLEQARAKFLARFPEYVEAHYDALTMARAAEDHRGMAQIAEPVLDRIFPKKLEGAGAAPQITVILTPEQLVGVAPTYAAPVMVVDAAPVSVLPESTDG